MVGKKSSLSHQFVLNILKPNNLKRKWNGMIKRSSKKKKTIKKNSSFSKNKKFPWSNQIKKGRKNSKKKQT